MRHLSAPFRPGSWPLRRSLPNRSGHGVPCIDTCGSTPFSEAWSWLSAPLRREAPTMTRPHEPCTDSGAGGGLLLVAGQWIQGGATTFWSPAAATRGSPRQSLSLFRRPGRPTGAHSNRTRRRVPSMRSGDLTVGATTTKRLRTPLRRAGCSRGSPRARRSSRDRPRRRFSHRGSTHAAVRTGSRARASATGRGSTRRLRVWRPDGLRRSGDMALARAPGSSIAWPRRSAVTIRGRRTGGSRPRTPRPAACSCSAGRAR